MIKILVVEDDSLLNHTLCYNLSLVGYTTESAVTKTSAMQFCKKQEYDLIVLDVSLPDGSGFDFCREIKKSCPDTAVIFLTADDMESDMLKGFAVGAEDYVTKPFPVSVFQKKVEALVNRIQKRTDGECWFDGHLHLNFSENTAALNGEIIAFTAMEYRILKLFVQNSNIVLTRQILLEKLWDIHENFVDEHALTAAVSRVRKKLEAGKLQYIKTVYGMGYMWIGGQN